MPDSVFQQAEHAVPEDELAAWLRLMQTPGVGAETARRLLGHFGLPHQVFSADVPALRQVVGEHIAHALLRAPDGERQALIERSLLWNTQPGNHIVTLADAAYPAALLQIPDPPVMLYIKGRIDLLSQASIAVVGSRNATAQGIANAGAFSAALSHAGFAIVSGMALGIDAAAHEGGLQGHGSTIAVIGTGIDLVYPARNRALAHRIAEHGCIVSEYALGVPAIAGNFPRRNRIISGLARGVLVVEAALQSGSLITARMAAEQGRDTFAIPGSIHSPLAKGCHQLIKQGAKLVESAQDILEELQYADVPQAAVIGKIASDSTPPVETGSVLHAMGFDAVDADTLAMRCEMDMTALHAELLMLELDGRIEMLPGGSYRRIH